MAKSVCDAAIAAIKFSIENDLPKQVHDKGEYLMEKLGALKEKYGILTDVRGKGLLIGLEYQTAEMGWDGPFPKDFSAVES